MKQISVKSYAKVNLMLRVISKKENGYHELQMLNKKINLFDKINIKYDSIDSIKFLNEEIDNAFLFKVLNHLKDIYNIKKCFNITIEKNIPLGSGMGGASMNAATIINEILKLENIEDDVQNKINNFKHMGADIAYGFFDEIAIVEDEGNKVYPLSINISKPLVLVNPNIFVSTKAVFEKNNIYNKKEEHSEIINKIENDDIYVNDLEQASFELNKELKSLKNNLSKYGKVVMSGTGSTLIVHTNKFEQIKQEYPKYLVLKIN